MRLGLIGVLVVVSAWSSAGWSRSPAKPQERKVKTYTAGNVAFNAQADDVTLEKIGTGCWEVRLADPNAEFKTAWIRFVVKSKDQMATLPPQQDAMQYFKLTFLGVENPPDKKVTRKFGARAVEGDLHHATKPANQTMEVYRLNQADGGVIAINFARADSFAAATAEALFAGVAGSIHLTKSE
jgi:hypothetical protein